MLTGLGVVTGAAPALADVTLIVNATTSNTANCNTTPCTLQGALDFAAAQTGVVTVSLTPGVYDAPAGSGGFTVPNGSESGLIIQGAGNGTSPSASIVHTSDDRAGNGWGFTIADTVTFPVRVQTLRITTATPPATDSAAPGSGVLEGIENVGTGALTVDRVVIDSLTGTAGADGVDCTAAGAGGFVVGVQSPDLTVTNSRISGLTGGAGGNDVSEACTGGTVMGISAKDTLQVTDSRITGLTGGAGRDGTATTGAPGGDGGGAFGIQWSGDSATLLRVRVSDVLGGAGGTGGSGASGGAGGFGGGALGIQLGGRSTVTITDTEVRGVTGGVAGAGGTGTAGNGGRGGAGTLALGIQAFGSPVTVRGTTVAAITGGSPGAGGDSTGGGTPGKPGSPGRAEGLFVDASPPGATVTVADSTVTDVTAGAGLGTGVLTGRGDATLTHVTITGAQTGLDGDSVTLVASLLDNPTNCTNQATVTDGGYNVTNDDGNSCHLGATSDVTHTFAPGELAPLANNGGPTDTIALAATSGAARQVPVSAGLCTGNDQRGPGFPRPGVGAPTACAAGAFEPQPPHATPQPPGPGNRDNAVHPGDPCGAVTTRPHCPR